MLTDRPLLPFKHEVNLLLVNFVYGSDIQFIGTPVFKTSRRRTIVLHTRTFRRTDPTQRDFELGKPPGTPAIKIFQFQVIVYALLFRLDQQSIYFYSQKSVKTVGTAWRIRRDLARSVGFRAIS